MVENSDGDTFLDCYHILDLTGEKGIYCTKLLADLGAEVTLVEPPAGHKSRHRGPFFHDDPHPEKSLNFLYFNTNKRSVTLDLEQADGQAIFKQLVKGADVVVEDFPVGYLKGLGLDYDSLSAINPKLVMASITPFGQTGPWKDYKGSDLIAMAASGFMQITGDPDKPPLRLGNEQSHYPPSQYASVGILAALYHRDFVSGEGQYIDISMLEGLIPYHLEQHQAAMWRFMGQEPIRVGLHSYIAVPLGVYPCKDGWAVVLTPSDGDWDELARWVVEETGEKAILDEELRGLLGDGRRARRDEVIAYIMGLSTTKTKYDFFHEGQRRDLGIEPVNTPEDLLDDPHLAASDFWIELEHPVVGNLKYPRRGPFFGDDCPELRKAAPQLGEDNESVYCDELRYSKEDMILLRSRGVI
ncbi:CaiB/BaiF CoA transferase family protein [Chloroflexota bacterium]